MPSGKRSKPGRRRFTAEGLQRLREAALRTQPWKFTTGPCTREGKARVSQNARKHGLRCAPTRDAEAAIASTFRALEGRKFGSGSGVLDQQIEAWKQRLRDELEQAVQAE